MEKNLESVMQKGQEHLDAGEWEEAVRCFREALLLQPDFAGTVEALKRAQQGKEAELAYNLGLRFFALEQWEKGIAKLKEAEASGFEFPDLRAKLEFARKQQQALEKSIRNESKGRERLDILTGSLWTEALFAWGTLAASISLATILYAVILTLGYQPSWGIPIAAIPMLLMIGGSFFVRQRRLARRMGASQQTEIEQLLYAFEKLSNDDRREVIRRVLDEEYRLERKRTLFAMYLLLWSIFFVLTAVVAAIIQTYSSEKAGLLTLAVTAIGLVVYLEGLPRAIRALRMRTAERALERLLA